MGEKLQVCEEKKSENKEEEMHYTHVTQNLRS